MASDRDEAREEHGHDGEHDRENGGEHDGSGAHGAGPGGEEGREDADGLRGVGVLQPLWPGDPRRIGPYALLGRLGSGGMGRVYLARSGGGRTVAVKAVHEEHLAKPRFRARFRREIEAARRVGDRFTAPVLDADADAAQPWIATGYVPGPGLDAVVREYGPLPAHSVRALADGLLRALRGIHAAGIVHRDLKPSNVLLTVEGPRVIDFGIAYALEPSDDAPLTSTGTTVGSPGFMAPEQILGEEPGPEADVFALGGVLVYAATGRLPFGHGASNQHAVLYQIVESDPDLTTVEDEALRAFIGRCLTKDADERPGVDALLDELAATTDTESETAGPWLPPRVVAHLAQQSARLLDAEATPPVPDAGAVATAGAGAGAGAVGVTGGAARERRGRPRARTWAVVGAVLAVVAAGGTVALLDRDGDARADSPERGSAARDSEASPGPHRSGARDADGEKGGKGDGKESARDGAPGDDGRTSGGTRGGEEGARGADGKDGKDGKDASAGDGGGDGGKDPGSGSGSGDPGGGASGGGSGGGDGGGSGGGDAPSGTRVPKRFVGTWKLGSVYGGTQPTEIRIYNAASGGRAALLVSDNGPFHCTTAAPLTGVEDGGERLRVGTAKVVEDGTPGYCQDSGPSSFTLDSSSVLRHHPASYAAGYTYKRG
ncbi:hypothetical protein GCM10009801_06530 [Streptomyces albiaxialis]|uniref:Protein kinase domain-containing protein n=1 Tax=Streptomyces albiaxialis TaxID=329523 RepID=A0ABN2VIT5_9ACTN